MNTEIKFMQTGGVPLTNDLLDVLQSTYDIYNCIAPLAGNLTIISGCELSGSYVNPGVVAIDGEVLPFVGGVAGSTVYINIESQSETFQDQTDKVLIIKKTVQFGNASIVYNWVDFVKLETIKELQLKVNNGVTQQEFAAAKADIELLKLKTAPIINGGVVWAFFKPVDQIPVGWKECLNIRGKTIVGLDPNYTYNPLTHIQDFKLNVLGETTGELQHKITQAEIPNYNLKRNVGHETPKGGYDLIWSNAPGNSFEQVINSGGGDKPHNNVQPSVIANFIEPNF